MTREELRQGSTQPKELSAILDAADRRIDEGAGIEHDSFWRKIDANYAKPGKSASEEAASNATS